MPKNDQVQSREGEEQSEEKTMTLDERFDKGWEQLEELTATEHAAKPKKKEAAAETEKGEGEKKDAPAEKKDASTSDKKPYKVLKVRGETIPVFSKEELVEKLLETVEDDQEVVDLAQMRIDYRKKTQDLAKERRQAESEIQSRTDKLTEHSAKLEQLLDTLVKNKVIRKADAEDGSQGEEELDEERAKIYEEFKIDPATALPHEKQIVSEVAANRKKLTDLEAMVNEDRQARVGEYFDKIIREEREKHPYEDILDDQGQNLTLKKFESIIMEKKKEAEDLGEKPTRGDYDKWIRGAVKEVSEAQAQKKADEPPALNDDMDPSEFMEKFPGLSGKLQEAMTEKALAEAAEKKKKLPPTIDARSRSIDTKKPPKARKEGESLDDLIDRGFEDPEVLAAFNLGATK